MTAGMLVFLLGITSASVQWKTNVDRTNLAQSDSIYINAHKYEALQEYCIQIQAVNRAQTERLYALEVSSTIGVEILLDLYKQETGKEWEMEQ